MTEYLRTPYDYVDEWKPDPGCIVEIGSERGAGSTNYLSQYADKHGLKFYSVDIDPFVTAQQSHFIGISAINARGIDFLEQLEEPISIAYLDGFDWTYDPNSDLAYEQRIRYKDMGMNLSNERCQSEHLREAEIVVQKSTKKSLIIIDDTYRSIEEEDGPFWHRGNEDTYWWGKGGLAVPYLEEEGYKVMNNLLSDEHVVLAREIS